MSKESVRSTGFYQEACHLIHLVTKYTLFLNTEPNQLEMVQKIGDLEDLEAQAEAFLSIVREAKGKLASKFTLEAPRDDDE